MAEHEEDEYIDVIDPRDDVLGTFHYWFPKPIPKEAQYNGVLGFSAGVEQLILIDLLEHGLIVELGAKEMALTKKGVLFVESRLEKWPNWSDYAIKPGAPALPDANERLLDALRGEDFRNDSKRFEPFLSSCN